VVIAARQIPSFFQHSAERHMFCEFTIPTGETVHDYTELTSEVLGARRMHFFS
jgi:hypothetical protein